MRANVVLPDDLIREIDKIAGARKRSEFLEEAALTEEGISTGGGVSNTGIPLSFA